MKRLVLFLFLLSTFLVDCSSSSSDGLPTSDKFETVEIYSRGFSYKGTVYLIYDKNTKLMYYSDQYLSYLTPYNIKTKDGKVEQAEYGVTYKK